MLLNIKKASDHFSIEVIFSVDAFGRVTMLPQSSTLNVAAVFMSLSSTLPLRRTAKLIYSFCLIFVLIDSGTWQPN